MNFGKRAISRVQLVTVYSGQEVTLGELRHHVFIMKLINRAKLEYRAFCGGSIIHEKRVLSSAHCFYTNRKRFKHEKKWIKVVAGITATFAQHPVKDDDDVQQWRAINKVFTQKYFRFPAYNLAVVDIEKPWAFNSYVNKIPYASLNQNFDGICIVIAVRPARSWSTHKFLFTETFNMLKRRQCETRLLRDCRLFYCTDYDSRKLLLQSVESEGGGLICKGTGDPMETDDKEGVLVGVTSLIYSYLPTLHHRVGPFHKWITDGCKNIDISIEILFMCLIIKLL